MKTIILLMLIPFLSACQPNRSGITIIPPTETSSVPTLTAQPVISQTAPSVLDPNSFSTKEPVIAYGRLPGDGGGCLADYLGWTAPTYVIYPDGQLLDHNPTGDPWYSQRQLGTQEVDAVVNQIASTGFFSTTGDGSLWENDPIYQFPRNFEAVHGGGTIFLQAYQGEINKKVTVYIPYLNYLIPEVANALQVIWDTRQGSSSSYQPKTWVAWVENADPCESYRLEYLPWPEELPEIASMLTDDHGQLVFQDSHEAHYNTLLGNKPETYSTHEGNVTYYIITRPLLPHELPSDFIHWR